MSRARTKKHQTRKGSAAGGTFMGISMTGFGRAASQSNGVSIEVEIKSVNSRFLDCALRLPREYTSFEPDLRELLSAEMNRGRVELTVTRAMSAQAGGGLRFNRKLFAELVTVYKSALKAAGIKEPLDDDAVFDILSRREVLEVAVAGQHVDRERSLLLDTVKRALQGFHAMRVTEGKKLAADLLGRLSTLKLVVKKISDKAASAPQEQRVRLEERLKKLLADTPIDEARICTEAAVLADRVDVSEELVRLHSHFSQFADALRESPNGRKLEFLLQEFGREFNTIGSKAQHAETQALVVNAKTEIEKMREQVQNIE